MLDSNRLTPCFQSRAPTSSCRAWAMRLCGWLWGALHNIRISVASEIMRSALWCWFFGCACERGSSGPTDSDGPHSHTGEVRRGLTHPPEPRSTPLALSPGSAWPTLGPPAVDHPHTLSTATHTGRRGALPLAEAHQPGAHEHPLPHVGMSRPPRRRGVPVGGCCAKEIGVFSFWACASGAGAVERWRTSGRVPLK